MLFYLGSLWFTVGRKLFGDEHGVSVQQWDEAGLHHVVVDIDHDHRLAGNWPDERDCAG